MYRTRLHFPGKLKTQLALFGILLIAAPVLLAADKWYQIEVILFQNTGSKPEEKLAKGTVLPDTSSGFQISAIGDSSMRRGNSVAFRTLGISSFSLTKQYSQLTASPKYTPIVHLAWRQPVRFKNKGFKAILKGGQVVTVQSATNNNENNEPENSPADATPANNTSLPDSKIFEVTGEIVISRSKFIHFSTDLIYRKRSANGDNQFDLYRMKERRKMKSRELHFIDHPMFGMLVYIKPI